MPDTTDLYTTVKNVSGAEKFFGFLGRHGKRVSSNGTYTVFGGSVPHLYGYNKRKQVAFENSLTSNKLEVLKTPRVILQDTAPDAAVANPTTQATAADNASSGGSLAAGTYQVDYTFYNSWGESTAGTGRSATFTVASGHTELVTLPAIPTNATGIKVYLTNTSAPSGTAKYYNKITSGTTLNLVSGSWNEGTQTYSACTITAPTSNTTAAASVLGVKVTDNTLGTVDPSWGRYTG